MEGNSRGYFVDYACQNMSALDHPRNAQARTRRVGNDEDIRQMSLRQSVQHGLLRMWPADHAELAARCLIKTLWRCRLNYFDAVPQLRDGRMQSRPYLFEHFLILFRVRVVIFMERKPVFCIRERGHGDREFVLRRATIEIGCCIEDELCGFGIIGLVVLQISKCQDASRRQTRNSLPIHVEKQKICSRRLQLSELR